MNMISTTSMPAAAPAPMPAGAPLSAAPAQLSATPAAPLFFAQFLGIEAAVGAEVTQEADSPPEGAADAAPADAPAAQADAAPAADLPGMAMLMMPPPPPALPVAQAPMTMTAGDAEPQNSVTPARAASQSAVPMAAVPARAAPQPAVPVAAVAAPVAAAASAAVSAAFSASAAAVPAPAPERKPAADAPSTPAFAAVYASAGAIALPPTAAAPVRAEQSVPAAKPSAEQIAVAAKPAADQPADATSVKAAETATRSFAADASTWGVAAPVAPLAANLGSATVTLEGAPQQWQQTLRDALGERLQTQVGRNSEQAVIRLDPPQLGRIEIAIRHSAGALQVTLSATHGDVLRQLHTIGDSVRQQLSQQAFTEVALTVVPATARSGAAQSFADGGGRQREQPQRDDAQPGRALSDSSQPAATFAMQPERNYS